MAREDARSDAELLAATPMDRDAFAAFYRRHVDAVLRYALSQTRRPELAADICAEVFAAALEKHSRFDPKRGAARSWLFALTSSRLIDARRRGAIDVRARTRLGMTAIELSEADIERIEDLLDPQLDLVAQLMAGLPSDQRDAVRRRIVEERDYSEIAASVGLSEHVIRKRVSRGLDAMRSQVQEEAT
jgi:RNA polymerase sigma-70 factor (ECF subfamily)